MSKLIIIRGNSGSGKSSVAKFIREQARDNEKIALIEQDYLRRFILKEKERDNGINIGLIKQTVLFTLDHDYHVILEGILYAPRYKNMLMELINEADKHFVYYLDVSLEETLKRHQSKPNAHEFGEKEMRRWYRPLDVLNLSNEIIINEQTSRSETVQRILSDTKL